MFNKIMSRWSGKGEMNPFLSSSRHSCSRIAEKQQTLESQLFNYHLICTTFKKYHRRWRQYRTITAYTVDTVDTDGTIYTVYTINIVYTVDMVSAVDMVFTVNMANTVKMIIHC